MRILLVAPSVPLLTAAAKGLLVVPSVRLYQHVVTNLDDVHRLAGSWFHLVIGAETIESRFAERLRCLVRAPSEESWRAELLGPTSIVQQPK